MTDQHSLPEHVARNGAHWDQLAAGYVSAGERNWTQDASWGIWNMPETQLHLLDDVAGAPDEDNVPAGEHLLRPAFGMHRFEWPDDTSVEFHLNHGDWVRLLRANGFEILDLLELQAPQEAVTASAPYVTAAWARRWPSEEVWIARRRG
jgi:hypothetical protein